LRSSDFKANKCPTCRRELYRGEDVPKSESTDDEDEYEESGAGGIEITPELLEHTQPVRPGDNE